MFNLGWSELLVVGIVALIAIGPKELPGMLRMAAQWIGKARRLAGDFQGQFQQALREADLADAANELTSAMKSVSDGGDLDLGLNTLEDKSAKPAGESASLPAPSDEFALTPAPKGLHPSWHPDKSAEELAAMAAEAEAADAAAALTDSGEGPAEPVEPDAAERDQNEAQAKESGTDALADISAAKTEAPDPDEKASG